MAVLINGDRRATSFVLPSRYGYRWRHIAVQGAPRVIDAAVPVDGRTVEFANEVME
ncbi:MAG: hypothetical protein AB7P20_24240 [Rhizobiaceae bacterium]